MTVKQAQDILNTFGSERNRATKSNMDWMPSRTCREQVSEAKKVILQSENGERKLNKAGQNLYYSENF